VWDLPVGCPEALCLECTRGRRQAGMWTCRRCSKQKVHKDFSDMVELHGAPLQGDFRRCNECVQRFEAEETEIARRSVAHVQKKARHEK